MEAQLSRKQNVEYGLYDVNTALSIDCLFMDFTVTAINCISKYLVL